MEELERRSFDLAAELKAKTGGGRAHSPAADRQDPLHDLLRRLHRTRNSFETGITQLGGHGIYLSPDKMQISHGENARDTANVLSRYGEGIAIRHCAFREGNDYIREVAEHASVPVISMQCDVYHPCQILADMLTIRERFGNDTKGLKLGRRLDLGTELRAAAVGAAEPDPDDAPLRHRRHPRLPARVPADARDRSPRPEGQR